MPQPVSHQTVVLSRGRHRDVQHGVCVMELASMLAGERFSDHPASVSPVIAGFLREYNDRIDDARRPDLLRFATEAVGTRASADVERVRSAMCRNWARARLADADCRGWRSRRLRVSVGVSERSRPAACGVLAARVAAAAIPRGGDAAHDRALAFAELLIATHAPLPAASRGLDEQHSPPVWDSAIAVRER
jgi:hypothetical protein